MKKWLGGALSAFLIPATLSASSSFYSKAEALYYSAGVPDSKNLKAESLWNGTCISSNSPRVKRNGEIFFHVDTDAVVADKFYMIPLFNTPDAPLYSTEAEKGLAKLKAMEIKNTVAYDASANAWYGYVEGSEGYPFWLRFTTKNGIPVLLLRALKKASTVYCYYSGSNTSAWTDPDATVVAPPKL